MLKYSESVTMKPEVAECHMRLRTFQLQRDSLLKAQLELYCVSIQREGKSKCCPRCGRILKQNLIDNPLCQSADVYICECCGREEQIKKTIPFNKWWLFIFKDARIIDMRDPA